jgi:hypothetical protein
MFWADETEGKIYRADLDGSNVTEILIDLDEPSDIEYLGNEWNKIYWLAQARCGFSVRLQDGDTLIEFTPESDEFRVVTGLLSQLHETGDFSMAECLGSFGSSPAIDPLPDPPTDDGRYYLAHGLDHCTGAGYGDSTLDPDPRDPLLQLPCP